ncbi:MULTISPECIES: hypothetical protein [Cytobacillus]|uniref:hypothetical protein n=1 Tax=Cytobacillus TaxID=2675230 RepID=UPI000DE929F6|nr:MULTISPECIES: hypothetical protein [Cytobacillus]
MPSGTLLFFAYSIAQAIYVSGRLILQACQKKNDVNSDVENCQLQHLPPPKRQRTPFPEDHLVLEANRMRVMQTLPQDAEFLICLPKVGEVLPLFLYKTLSVTRQFCISLNLPD